MGLETIKDLKLRKNWELFIEKTHIEFDKNNIPLRFTTFKDDGSYAKSQSGTPAVYFAFAEDANRTWVELELKPRMSKGEKFKQTELYNFIKETFKNSGNNNKLNITWDEDDEFRKPGGLPIRIKEYLASSDKNEWISKMTSFVLVFLPILNGYKKV